MERQDRGEDMVDLFDARGYDVTVNSLGDPPVTIQYLGAVRTEHAELLYDEDPYVVSHVEGQEFTREFQASLKDPGIRKSGLRIKIAAKAGTEVSVKACGEEVCAFTVGEEGQEERTVDVSGLCRQEREYLAHIHRILYLLLAEADRICEKHGISYFLVFGGLLGALRHGDIIPWDDDIDIAMTRADFQRFQKIAPAELGEGFRYLDCSEMGGGAFLDFMCRILYTKETVPGNVFRKVRGKCRKDLENHLPLDIFILDKASDNPYRHKLQMLLVRGVYGLGMGHRAIFCREEYQCRDFWTRISVRLLSGLGKAVPAKCIFWLHDRICTMHEKKETKDYFMSNGFLPFIHTRYSREWFQGGNRMKLGDMEARVPADAEAYLKRAYYEYYHYPPMCKRIPEHSPDAEGVF